VDGGAYLLSVNTVLGDEPTNAGFPRPPLAPGWLLVPFLSAFGDDVGYKVWSTLASMLPVIPVYLFAKRINHRYAAPFAVAFLLVDLLHAEMIVTGALPLIGFSLLGLVWWAMCSLSERWSWRAAATLTLSLGLIPWVNQTTAGLAIVTIPVLFLALLWYNRSAPGIITKRILPPLVFGGSIALGALPWYMDVLPVTGILNYPGPFIYLTHAFDSAWWQFLLAWPLGLWMIRRGKEPWLRSLGVLTVLLGTLLVFLSTDETVINIFYRSRYLLAIPFYVGISWVIWDRLAPQMPPWLKTASPWLSGAAMVILVVGYVSQFNRQTGYSDMATPATVEALELIAREDPGAGVVNNSFTLALWISALNKVPSPHTWTWQPPSRFIETDKDVRCVLGWVVGCDHSGAAGRLGAGYVLIDTRFPNYNSRAPGIYLAPENQWEVTAETPWLTKIFEKGATLAYKISSGGRQP